MSRTVDMLALTCLIACRAHAPAEPCSRVMLGACADPTPEPPDCERGRALDLDDDRCTTARDARDLARTAGIYVDDQDTITCASNDDVLVASTRLGKIGCLARAANRRSPPPTPSPSSSSPSSSSSSVLDLPRWTQAAAVALCGALARSPAVLAAPETVFEVELVASVPDNDVTQGFVRGRVLRGDVAPGDLDRALRPIDDALRRQVRPTQPRDGRSVTASASEAQARATCRGFSRRPISVP